MGGGCAPGLFREVPPGLPEGDSTKVLSLRAKLEFSENSLATPRKASPANSFFTDHSLRLISVLRLFNTKYTKP